MDKYFKHIAIGILIITCGAFLFMFNQANKQTSLELALGSSVTSLQQSMTGSTSMAIINANFSALNTDKLEHSDLSGGEGVTYSTGAISFDCSEVEGTGVNCTGEDITLDATGDWTGTLDSVDGAAFLTEAEYIATTSHPNLLIEESNLNINSPTDLYLLVASSSATGGMEWMATSSSLLNFAAGGGGGGSGTVTSVAMTVPTGLSVSGSPVTTSGTLALSLTGGYNIPSDASTTNWNTSYDWGDHSTGGTYTGNLILDDGSSHSPWLYFVNQADDTANIYVSGSGNDYLWIGHTKPVAIYANLDINDYFLFSTLNNIPSLTAEGSYLRIGTTTASSHSLSQNSDVLINGSLEVDSSAYFDGDLTFGNASSTGITATTFWGSLVGNVTGTASGNLTSSDIDTLAELNALMGETIASTTANISVFTNDAGFITASTTNFTASGNVWANAFIGNLLGSASGNDVLGQATSTLASHTSTYNHANYDTAYGWGDHAGLYDVIGQATSTLSSHTSTYNHANYDTVYGWGDHAGLYDVVGQATSTLGTHTSTYNHTNYDTAYTWGYHGDAGYLLQAYASSTYMVDTDIDTISELNSWVTDATLLISGGTLTSGKYCTYDGTGIDCSSDGGGGGSSLLTTKGDLLTYSSTSTRFAVGTDGYVLTASSTSDYGIAWAEVTGGNFEYEEATSTNGQTVFDISGFTFTVGSNNLEVFVNGVYQIINDSYVETDNNTVTFNTGLNTGDRVVFAIRGGATATAGSTLTQEEVEDYVGAMTTGNTETNITVTYQDGDGTIDFEVTDAWYNSLSDLQGSVSNDFHNLGGTDATTTEAEILGLGFIQATLTDEELQDKVGAMTTGNTETNITVTYQDDDGTLDFVVTDAWYNSLSDIQGAVSNDFHNLGGTDATTTEAEILGLGFIQATLTDEEVQDKVGAMVTGNTETDLTVTYEDADGTLDFILNDTISITHASTTYLTATNIWATSFIGALTGNVTGTASGNLVTANIDTLAELNALMGETIASTTASNANFVNDAGYLTSSSTIQSISSVLFVDTIKDNGAGTTTIQASGFDFGNGTNGMRIYPGSSTTLEFY